MDRSQELTVEILGGNRTYPIGYVIGEVQELVAAICKVDLAGIREEFADASYAIQMWLWQRLPVNVPIFCAGQSIDKFRARNAVWRRVFEDEGIVFSVYYLVGGSNFAKVEKIVAAFAAARVSLTPDAAVRLRDKAISMLNAGIVRDISNRN